jgi:hypothetical protein
VWGFSASGNNGRGEYRWFQGDDLTDEQKEQGWTYVAVGKTYLSEKGDLILLGQGGKWANLGYAGKEIEFYEGAGADFFKWYLTFAAENAVGGAVGHGFGALVDAYKAYRATQAAVQIAEGGITIATSGGGETAAMQVVRIIQKGEKLEDLVNEGKALLWESGGKEHAIVTLANGDRAIVSGGKGGIEFAEGQIQRIFGHIHPTSAPPSALDVEALRALGQSKQYVLHGGETTVVRPK